MFQESYSNVLGVLTAMPLSRKNHSTAIPSSFKEDLLDSLNDILIKFPDINCTIRLKYETLSAASLRETMKLGCRVLYIDSKIEPIVEPNRGLVVEPNHGLVVESDQKTGEYDVIDYESLKELLSIRPEVLATPTGSTNFSTSLPYPGLTGHKLMIVIIDTPPDSTLREKLFSDLKDQYIVWFDRSSAQQQEPLGYNHHLIFEEYKQMFVISFMQNLVSKDNVMAAFKEAQKEVKKLLIRSFDAVIDFAKLETPNSVHASEQQALGDVNLMKSNSIQSKRGEKVFHEFGSETTIKLEDISMPLCPTNIPKIFLPFTGRQEELEKLCRALESSDESFIQIIGKKGYGKTRLVLEAANYIISRHHRYKDGIYYFSNKKQNEALFDTIRSTFSPSGQPLKSLDVIFKNKRKLVIIDDYNDKAASILHVLIDQKINTIIVTENDFRQNSKIQHKLKTPETVEVKPLETAELLEIIESYTGVNLPRQLPDYDAVRSLENAFESPKRLLESLTSVNCQFPTLKKDEFRVKGAYLEYINLDRLFEEKVQENVTPISTDELIFSKNSKHFKGTLGTKEPEIIINLAEEHTIESPVTLQKWESEEVCM